MKRGAISMRRLLVPLQSPPEGDVRDIEEVLKEKQIAIEKVRREIEALYSVTPLLSDGPEDTQPNVGLAGEAGRADELKDAMRTVAALLVDDADEFDAGVRARLIEAAMADSQRHQPSRFSVQLRHLAGPLLGWRGDRDPNGSALR